MTAARWCNSFNVTALSGPGMSNCVWLRYHRYRRHHSLDIRIAARVFPLRPWRGIYGTWTSRDVPPNNPRTRWEFQGTVLTFLLYTFLRYRSKNKFNFESPPLLSGFSKPGLANSNIPFQKSCCSPAVGLRTQRRSAGPDFSVLGRHSWDDLFGRFTYGGQTSL